MWCIIRFVPIFSSARKGTSYSMDQYLVSFKNEVKLNYLYAYAKVQNLDRHTKKRQRNKTLTKSTDLAIPTNKTDEKCKSKLVIMCI